MRLRRRKRTTRLCYSRWMPLEKTCTEPGCTRGHYARGLCNMHWQRLRRIGSTQAHKNTVPAGLSIEQRFRAYGWRKTDRGCWLWLGPREAQGYGTLKVDGVTHKAHRVALSLTGVTVAPGDAVLHSCDNPPCVNPAHLRVGTWRDNAKDRDVRLRNGRSKLSPEQVRRIRTLYATGEHTQAELGSLFGVTFQTISRVIRKQAWSHV